MPSRSAAAEKLPAVTTSANTTIAEAFRREPSFLIGNNHIRLCSLWNRSDPPIFPAARPYGEHRRGESLEPTRSPPPRRLDRAAGDGAARVARRTGDHCHDDGRT